MAELTARLIAAVGGLAESPPVGSLGQWNTEDVHTICFDIGDADGLGWLGSRRVSAPAYRTPNLHPQGRRPSWGGRRLAGVRPARSQSCRLPRRRRRWRQGAGTPERKGSDTLMPKQGLCALIEIACLTNKL